MTQWLKRAHGLHPINSANEAQSIAKCFKAMPWAKPAVRRWLVKDLGFANLTRGTPPTKQLYDNPVTAGTTCVEYTAGTFNNPAMYTNAVVVVGNQEPHIPEVIVAKACGVLAT
ncbi:TPA: hypothetical protein ACH3X2_001749 [Trebouxia sp. C0005]